MNAVQAPVTLTALFLHADDAKKAQEALRLVGVAPENLAVGDATVIERERVEKKEGFLHRIFSRRHDVPEKHRVRYEEHVKKGATVIAVAAPEDLVDQVVDVLNYHNAKDFAGEELSSIRKPAPTKESSQGARTVPNEPHPDNRASQEAARNRMVDTAGPPSDLPGTPDIERRSDPRASLIIPDEVDLHPEIERRSERRGGVRVYSSLGSGERTEKRGG